MTIDFIKAANPRWFEASPYFGTRVHSRVYHAHAPEICYFVTSEDFAFRTGRPNRHYTVRRFNVKTGEISTVQTQDGSAGFGTFHTRAQAHAYAFALSNESRR